MTDMVHRYLRLGLRFGRLGDGLVERYLGPPEVAEAVRSEPPPTPQAVGAEAEALLGDLPAGWLRDQVAGLHTYAGALAGVTQGFADEVAGCYGAHVAFTDESVFEAAHEQLSDLLPGPQPLAERYQRWRAAMQVPAERIAPLVTEIAELGRQWTQRLIPLPDGEHLELEFVQDQAWSGFHLYLGDFRGRVSINTGMPRTADTLMRLVLHETYPGHQAEAALKDHFLVRGQHRLEETLMLTTSPQTLISEGLAETGPDLVLETPEAVALAACLNVDLALVRAVEKATVPLQWAGINAAMMAYGSASGHADGQAYLRRWRLLEEKAAEQFMRFVGQPATRTYVAVYPAGHELCRSFVDGSPQRFGRLLTEQFRVSDLRGG